ncbi:MAG: D-alanyl-D-alanine carboxypeptidase [Lachnospiraceae bacterium]|nr:D-alanyl-D-alanine carboxypeptidase [Lachnospiraceae bacterium]
MKFIKEYVAVMMLVCFVFVCVFSYNAEYVQAEELSLYARSALLMDASNGRVLYEENGYQVMPMASTTKIMTCILALEYMEGCPEGGKEKVKVTAYAARMPKVHLGMSEGEEYYLEDLLYSLMLKSHNDTAVAIAEHIDGDVQVFAERMNRKAAELGCRNTNFITPNGLDAEQDGKVHASTAYDMGLIASYAIKNDTFREIIATPQYSFSELTQGRNFQIYNADLFLGMMDGAIGIKTGFTADAGYCFVGALEKDGKRFVSVVLASGWPPNKSWKWSDTKKLMKYGLENYEISNITKRGTYTPIEVEEGIKDKVTIAADKEKEEELTLLLTKDDKVSVKNILKDKMRAPVQKGTVVGYKCYFVNDKLYKKYEIKTTESVELRTYFYCLRQIFMIYF